TGSRASSARSSSPPPLWRRTPLLLTDPLGAFSRLRDQLILYVQTAFRTRFPSLEAEREQLLRSFGQIHQPPYVEPRVKYPGHRRLDELTEQDLNMTAPCRRAFLALLERGMFRGSPPSLYRHQVEMLSAVLAGRNAVVTTGTGSGKTEAFLMPVI